MVKIAGQSVFFRRFSNTLDAGQPIESWGGQGEPDNSTRTKPSDGLHGCGRNTIFAKCFEWRHDEIEAGAGRLKLTMPFSRQPIASSSK